MTQHVSLDQLRARHAWGVVEQVRSAGKHTPKEFQREIKRLPMRIHSAGLGQALAFLYAKSSNARDDAKHLILKHLAGWLLAKRSLAPRASGSSDRDAAIRAIMDGDAELLRRLTEEALLYLRWLVRFTEAQFGSDVGE